MATRPPTRCPLCKRLHAGTGRCPDCSTQADRARGTRQQRGLDGEYERARAAALATATHCATCGERFTEHNPATGGHVKDRRSGGTTKDGIVAQCRRCNYGWRRASHRGPNPSPG